MPTIKTIAGALIPLFRDLPNTMQKAPNFTLADQNGALHTLSDLLGKWVVVYFYPRDDTPGCTVEACNFRDNFKTLSDHEITIFGISKDSIKSHQKFQEKFALNFPLLSDPDKKILEAYGALGPKKFMGKMFMGVLRKTFLINPDGYIQQVYEGMKLESHAQDILNDVLTLRKTQAEQTMV